jgi:hypothetical protein
MELLKIVDQYLPLNMLTSERKLPWVKHCYMLITKDYDKLWFNVGKKASLTITQLIYDTNRGILAALVYLKHNFTCNKTPHIILAHRAHGDIDFDSSHIVRLEQPFKAHGRIGVLAVADNVVTRPETTLSVENPDPDLDISLSSQPQAEHKSQALHEPQAELQSEPRHKSQPQHEPQHEPQHRSQAPHIDRSQSQHSQHIPSSTDEEMQITITSSKSKSKPKSEPKEPIPTGEVYKGCAVMKGPRGGKFIMKEGKKIYYNGQPEESGKKVTNGSAVYKVNMLCP